MLTAQVYIEPAPLPAMPDVPGEVADLCRQCLDKDPANRPTARQVSAALAGAAGVRTDNDELAGVLDVEPPTGPARSPAARRPTGSAGSRRWARRPAVAGVVAGVAVAVGLGVWLVRAGDTNRPGPQQTAHQPVQADRPRTGQPRLDPSRTPTTPALPSGPPDAPVNSAGNAAPGPGTPRPPTGTTSPAATRTGTPPPNQPAPQQRSLSSVGGTVQATCTRDGLANLLSWTPTKPYKVERIEPGPAMPAIAAFRHGNRIVQMTITCAEGAPSATITGP